MGHEVQLISSQFVKPFVKSSKNNQNDAEAIAEAASRPSMRYVPVKSVEQQDIQMLNWARSLLLKERTAQNNQIRGLLGEYEITIRQSAKAVRMELPALLEDDKTELSPLGREIFADPYQKLVELDNQIAKYDQRIQQLAVSSKAIMRLTQVRGIGVQAASALVAAAGDAKDFKNGHLFAAWLELVPRQNSSDGKEKLLGIPCAATVTCARC